MWKCAAWSGCHTWAAERQLTETPGTTRDVIINYWTLNCTNQKLSLRGTNAESNESNEGIHLVSRILHRRLRSQRISFLLLLCWIRPPGPPGYRLTRKQMLLWKKSCCCFWVDEKKKSRFSKKWYGGKNFCRRSVLQIKQDVTGSETFPSAAGPKWKSN